ncbi:MAG: hypothetical protein HDR24_07660 [Lachnospiraceae bacterium]|nr:hypothetical protein [Lachnospiraceae bacterium]
MFEKWYFDTQSIVNVEKDGEVKGFSFEVKPTYYRGVYVSLVEKVGIWLDGQELDTTKLVFSVEDGTFTWDEMAEEPNARWKFGEKARIFIPLEGGIAAGHHEIRLVIGLRITYWGGFQHADVTFEFDI